MKVHYWELSNYNNGNLLGQWFELDGKTKYEHYSELGEWMAELTESTGELCEEWILGDVDEVPSVYVTEYSLRDELFEFIEAIDAGGLDQEILLAGIECGIDLNKIAEAYQGEFNSEIDLAESIINDCYDLDEMLGDLAWYFDFEKYGRDLMINDFMEHDGHYFSKNW